MLNKLKSISPALYAWSRLFFYITVAVLLIAVPLAYVAFWIWNPSLAFVLTIIVLFTIIYSGGKHGSFR